MNFNIKVNSGIIKKGGLGYKLSTEKLEKILAIKDYKELLNNNDVLIHDTYIKGFIFTMQESIKLYQAIKTNKDIKLVETRQKGFMYILSFTI